MSENAEPRPCPLCRHKAVLKVGDSPKNPNRIRCAYCGCAYGWPWSKSDNDAAIAKLIANWNTRAEYCQYCGSLVGAVEVCPDCGMHIAI